MAAEADICKPLPPGRLTLVTMSLALAVFMNVLDVSIANVSIPNIAGDLAVTSTQGTWIITCFAAANAVAVPISGWLAKRVGEVRLFVICTLLFTLASFVCGLSFSFPMLLIARTFQGAVAGPMIPISQSLLLANYPPERRGFANGVWGMTAVVGPVAGPILGGWITDNYHWSWIFYINIPVGILAALGTWSLLKDRETETARPSIDTIGLALLIVGVAALQVMLDQGNDKAWFQSPYIITFGIIATVALSFFVLWELTDDDPIVDLKLFKRRNFTVATIAVSLGFMAYFSGVVVLPLWLQDEQGYNATWAGITASSLGIMGFIFSPLIGRLADKFDARIIVTVGMLTFSILSFILGSFNTNVSFRQLFLTRLPWGIGLSCFFIPLITLSLSGLPPSMVASASGVFNFMRLIALSFGTSLSVTFWDHRASFHDHRLNESVTPYNAATQQWLAQAQDLGMTQPQAHASLAGEISNQAFMLSINDLYWLAGWLFLGLTVLVWFAKPASRRAAAEAH
jgi:MFS transporter, DHA2 family, multidrug resistance protein